MSAPTVDETTRRLNVIDSAIVCGWELVLEARRRWAHSPNPQTIAAAERATRDVDLMLEQRFALHPTHPTR